MATWQIEIMKLANDFCLNTNKVKEIVRNIEAISEPKADETWKYNKAHSLIVPMIMSM